MSNKVQGVKYVKYDEEYFQIGDYVSVSIDGMTGNLKARIIDVEVGDVSAFTLDCSLPCESLIRKYVLSRVVGIEKLNQSDIL